MHYEKLIQFQYNIQIFRIKDLSVQLIFSQISFFLKIVQTEAGFESNKWFCWIVIRILCFLNCK